MRISIAYFVANSGKKSLVSASDDASLVIEKYRNYVPSEDGKVLLWDGIQSTRSKSVRAEKPAEPTKKAKAGK